MVRIKHDSDWAGAFENGKPLAECNCHHELEAISSPMEKMHDKNRHHQNAESHHYILPEVSTARPERVQAMFSFPPESTLPLANNFSFLTKTSWHRAFCGALWTISEGASLGLSALAGHFYSAQSIL